MKKNILLLIAVLILSYFTAPYFGVWYNMLYTQHGGWIFSQSDAIFFAGLLISYIFFVPFVFELFSSNSKKKWILWFLVPIMLFLLYDNVKIFYVPVLFSVAAFLIAKLIRIIISKLKQTNRPSAI